jgi:hypothetical protein
MLLQLRLFIFLGLLCTIILVFYSCKQDNKDEDPWINCTTCTADSWIGEFTGSGDYNNFNNNSSKADVSVTINIEETAPDYLSVYFQAPSYLTFSVSGSLVSSYIISFAGSGSAVTSTMYTRDGTLRMNGSAKKYHFESDTLVTDEIINFEVLKVQ